MAAMYGTCRAEDTARAIALAQPAFPPHDAPGTAALATVCLYAFITLITECYAHTPPSGSFPRTPKDCFSKTIRSTLSLSRDCCTNGILSNPRAYRVVRLESRARTVTLPNQEIATKDQIALRVSFLVQYYVADYEKAFSLIDTSPFDRIASVMVMHAIDMAVFRKRLLRWFPRCQGMDSSAVFDALSSLEATKEAQLDDKR